MVKAHRSIDQSDLKQAIKTQKAALAALDELLKQQQGDSDSQGSGSSQGQPKAGQQNGKMAGSQRESMPIDSSAGKTAGKHDGSLSKFINRRDMEGNIWGMLNNENRNKSKEINNCPHGAHAWDYDQEIKDYFTRLADLNAQQ